MAKDKTKEQEKFKVSAFCIRCNDITFKIGSPFSTKPIEEMIPVCCPICKGDKLTISTPTGTIDYRGGK